MKTPYEIFKNHSEIKEHLAVQELIKEYDEVCDRFIDLQQVSGKSKEQPLRVLVKEIRESISRMQQHNEEATRFGYDDQLDYEQAIKNLQNYIREYLKDYNIYL